MIGTIRRHSQSLWWIIVVAVIISFVWFYGANNASMESLLGRNRGEGNRLYGNEIKTSALQASARQVEFNHFLQDRNNPNRRTRSDEQQRTETYQQVLLNHELRANGIIPGREALALAVQEEFKNPSKASTPNEVREGYNQFLLSLDKTSFNEADFVNLLRNQVGLGHLRDLVSVPAALVSPREAAEEFRRENESLLASAVVFNPTNFIASVHLTPENVGQYYSNNLARYYSDERLSMSYARFDASNHLAAAEGDLAKIPNLSANLQDAYARQTNQNAGAFNDAEGHPMTREAALAKLRSDYVMNAALQRAYKQAADFYNAMGKAKVTAESFMSYATNSAAAAAGFSLGVTPPQTATLVAFQAPFSDVRNAQEALGRLSPQAPFTIPMAGKDAVFIAVFRERIPAAIQPLATIKARVEGDYQRQETMNAARTAARSFLSAATNGLAAGKSFADLAKAQGATVLDLPAFSAAMPQLDGLPTGVTLPELKNALGASKAGDVQLLNQGNPTVVLLKERKAVAEESLKAGLTAFTEEIRQRRQGGLFGEWFRQKMEDSGLAAALTPAAPASAR